MVPKFRAWHMPFGPKGPMQEMVYGRASHILALAEMSPDEYIDEQFTGLKDRNGQDVYEGDMAMTPLDKRVEHKWNVIVGNDNSGFCNIVCWKKSEKSDSDFPYLLCLSDSIYLSCDDSFFTDEEFSDLIKYIKTLPNGEWQTSVVIGNAHTNPELLEADK